MKFLYQAEKFAQARRHLMLPHRHGISKAIFKAMMECRLGLEHLDVKDLDEHARTQVDRLTILMDMNYHAMSHDHKGELSDLVDQLADWFSRRRR